MSCVPTIGRRWSRCRGCWICRLDVVLCNLYYDALKVILSRDFGCTAFAIDAPGCVLHARNLDWWTENSALARNTATSHFVNAQGTVL